MVKTITSSTDYRDPVIEVYKRDIDRSLLRENLRLTVEQRFRKFEQFVRYALELKEAGRKSRQRGEECLKERTTETQSHREYIDKKYD